MVPHSVVNTLERYAYVDKVVAHVNEYLEDDVWSHNLLNFSYLAAMIRLSSCLLF